MPFKIPSLSETREFMIAVGKALFPDRNYGNARSYHSKRATFVAAGITQLHSHIDTVGKDVMPSTASDDVLDDGWGYIKGVTRKGATVSRKSGAARVRGTNGTAVPLNQELLHPASGLRFKIANATAIPATLFVDADIVAIDTGSQTKLLAGETLQFVATPVNLETQVILQKALDEGGEDSEPFGSYQKRILAAFSDETSGGSTADYVRWMLEIEGVDNAYAYANRAGFGTIDVVALHDATGAARELTAGEVATVLAYLKTKAPAHIAATGGPLRVLDIIPDPQPVEIVITPSGESAYAFDWSGGPLTALAWTAGTRELQFTAALPSTMKAGHRGSFKGVATAQDGAEFTIEALSGADKIILQTAPAIAPAATDLFYSGGPLVTPIRSALLAHINGETVYAGKGGTPIAQSSLASTIGLEVLAEGVGPANPIGFYGAWSGGLIRAVLGKIAGFKSGVRNYAIALPAADYEATDDLFPLDAQIHLVTASAVLVRGAT